MLKPEVLEEKQQELEKKFVELQQTYVKLERDLAGERDKLIQDLLKQAEPMIEEIAKAEGVHADPRAERDRVGRSGGRSDRRSSNAEDEVGAGRQVLPTAAHGASRAHEACGAEQILGLLPHRYPFLLIDRVLEVTDDRSLALKNVTFNEPYFQGHFPGVPVMPGVLQIEAMAQAGGILASRAVDVRPDDARDAVHGDRRGEVPQGGDAGRPAQDRGRAAAQGQDLQDEGRDHGRRRRRVVGGVPRRARRESPRSA